MPPRDRRSAAPAARRFGLLIAATEAVLERRSRDGRRIVDAFLDGMVAAVTPLPAGGGTATGEEIGASA